MMEGDVSRDRGRDADMDRLLRGVLGDPAAKPAPDCPSAGDLAAYCEHTLSGAESQAMETHLAACERCQHTLALFATMPAGPEVEVDPRASWWRAGWKRWLVPISALATAVVLYVALGPDAARPLLPSSEIRVAEVPSHVAQPPQATAPEQVALPPVEAPSASRPRAEAAPLLSRQARKVAGRSDQQAAKSETSPAGPPPRVTKEFVAPPVDALAAAPAAAPPMPPLPSREVEAGKQAADAPARIGGVPTLTENIIVTNRTPLTDSRVSTVTAFVVSPAANPDRQWRIERAGRIFRSTDRGASWLLQHPGAGQLFAAWAPSSSTCWAVGSDGLVLLTSDGETWAKRSSPERTDLVAVTATDDLHASVTTRAGARFTTADGGATWLRVR